MHHLLLAAAQMIALSISTSAFQLSPYEPFLSALPNLFEDDLSDIFQNATAHEDLKRANSNNCPSHYKVCSQSPNLCCTSNAVCSVDGAGMVACCPSGKQCTGTITGIITGGTVNGGGGIVGATTTGTSNNNGATTTATTTGFVGYTTSSSTLNGVPSTTTTATTSNNGGAADTNSGGFIIDGTSTVAAPNSGHRGVELVSGFYFERCLTYNNATDFYIYQPWFARVLLSGLLQYLPI